jgi:hypothetical protein
VKNFYPTKEEIRKRRAAERKELLTKERGLACCFLLSEDPAYPVEDQERDVARIAKELSGTGVTLELTKTDRGRILKLTVRENNLKNLKTRHAGRPLEDIWYQTDEGEEKATVKKVRGLITAYGAIGAAKVLGLSKAGMYKRLSTAEQTKRPCMPSDHPIGNDDLRF